MICVSVRVTQHLRITAALIWSRSTSYCVHAAQEDANPGTSCEGMRVRPNPSRVTMVRAMQLHKKMQTHTRRYNDLVFILSSCEGMRVRPNPSSMRSRIELLAAECAPRSGHDNLFSYLLTKLPALLSYFVLRIAQNHDHKHNHIAPGKIADRL